MRLEDLVAPQPAPLPRPGGVSMHDVAAALHRRRKGHGLDKYQSLLQAMNGRSADVDLVQEHLDALVYALQSACESAALAEALAEYRAALVDPQGERWARDGLEYALETFDALLGPVPLAQRADLVAQWLIAQDADESRADRPVTSGGASAPDRSGAVPAHPAQGEDGGTG